MSALVRLVLVVIIVIGGYWAYYVFAAGDPADRLGVAINTHMPLSAREFACKKLKERFGDIPNAPAGCELFAEWARPVPAAVTPPKS